MGNTSLISPPNQSLIRHVSDVIDAELNRRLWLWVALFMVFFLTSSIAKDIWRPMWNDELLTLYTAKQASSSAIVQSVREGTDGMPFYDMAVHSVLPVIHNEALAVRFPATLGYCALLLCLLAFCRRCLPTPYAIGAVLLACNACVHYSVEGRSYGVVLGCAAGALLCWQSGVAGRRRHLTIPLLAFCLALMTAMHYFSIFFIVPLFVAEIVRWRRSGRLDVTVLPAFLPALIVLGIHYPLIVAGRQFQSHFWSPATGSSLMEFYSMYLVWMLLMCVLPIAVLTVISVPPNMGNARSSTPTAPEWAVALALSMMPIVVAVLSKYMTHAFVARYVLWAVPGLAILLAACLYRLAHGSVVVGVSLLVTMLMLAIAQESVTLSHLRRRPQLIDGEMVRRSLDSLPDSTEPIIVADSHVFVELSYYEENRIKRRLVYPLSSDQEMRYFGYDTDSIILNALSHRTDLHIISYDSAIASHSHLVLAARPDNPMPWDLVKAGYKVIPIGSSVTPVLFEVAAPDAR